MANERFVDEVMSDINAAALGALREAAPDVTDSVVTSISKPVGRQGSRIIRSNPGEEPRKEKGGLARNIGNEIETSGDRSSLTVFASGKIAAYLENGTDRMEARPFMAPAFTRWKDRIYQRIADAIGRR